MSCFDEEPDAPLHGECEREINMLLQTIERLQKGVDAAVIIVRDYANDNPKHEYQGREQDPKGAHAWLAEFVRW